MNNHEFYGLQTGVPDWCPYPLSPQATMSIVSTHLPCMYNPPQDVTHTHTHTHAHPARAVVTRQQHTQQCLCFQTETVRGKVHTRTFSNWNWERTKFRLGQSLQQSRRHFVATKTRGQQSMTKDHGTGHPLITRAVAGTEVWPQSDSLLAKRKLEYIFSGNY